MGTKTKDAARAKVLALAHLPQRDIAKRTGVGLGTVCKILAETKGRPPAAANANAAPATNQTKKSPAKKPAKPAGTAPAPRTAPSPPADDADDIGDGTVIARLRRSLAALERAAEMAAADKDVARLVSAQKAIASTAALVARLEPPPPVDPNAGPDVVAAAKRFREGAHALLDRILGDAEAAS